MRNEIFFLKAAVEGILDEVVLRAILNQVGADVHPVYGKNGKRDLRRKTKNYARAARYEPWIILVDLDKEFECAPLLCKNWIQKPISNLCFRVAVRAVESWLLADRDHIASFLGISKNIIPSNPDYVEDPKQTLIDLARKSRRRKIKSDLVPSPKGGRKVGPAYTSSLIEFVIHPQIGWRPLIAANSSDSLRRCFEAINNLKSSSI